MNLKFHGCQASEWVTARLIFTLPYCGGEGGDWGVSYNQGQLDDGISWDSEETESHVILMLLQLKMFCVKKDRTIDHNLHMNEQI